MLLINSAVNGQESSSVITQELRWNLCKETALHYKQWGFKREWNEFRPFIFSAARVQKMFPMYPAKSDHDRMLIFYELGGLESFWEQNFMSVNIPGAQYSNGKVKKVSVDFTWIGLNEGTINWTYYVALAIQRGEYIPNHVPGTDWWAPKGFEETLKGAKIPKNLKLRKIDLKLAEEAKAVYYKYKKTIKDPNKLRKVVNSNLPPFEENTQDQIDSALIYRVIEELDRKCRNWPYGADLYNHRKRALYRHLSQFVE